MAKVANPRKVFNWSIEIIPDPINPFLFQKVDLPDTEIEVVEHGDTNHSIKTAGRVSYSNITAEKLMVSNEGDAYMSSWIDSCQSSVLGGGTIPELYKKTLLISELAEDGATVLNVWTAIGAWPAKVNGHELDRLASDNSIESIEFAIDKLQKL